MQNYIDPFGYLGNSEIDRPVYKPVLEVVETIVYNIDGTWAHTRPAERIIVMLPVGFRDYNKPIFAHEVIHNADPGADESAVLLAAYNPVTAKHAIDSFNYRFRRA